jgi:hypothetical protein
MWEYLVARSTGRMMYPTEMSHHGLFKRFLIRDDSCLDNLLKRRRRNMLSTRLFLFIEE